MAMSPSDRKHYAQEILSNPLFCDTIEKIKENAVSVILSLPWDDQGDAERRKEALKIKLADEIRQQFEIAIISDQAKEKRSRQK